MKIFEVLSSVLNGNPSDEEKAYFDKWMSESETNKKTFGYITKIKANLNSEAIKWDKERIWYLTQGKIKESQFQKTLILWRSIAASVAVLFMLSAILFFSNIPTSTQMAFVKTTTPNGITTMVELSDGSVVYLNAGSELQYPSVFTDEKREVILTGEAYFEVTENKQKPFIVEANGINVKVLGTRFNVQAYNDNSEVITTLIEGAVSVRDSSKKSRHKEIILKPGYKAVFSKKAKNFRIKQVTDAELYVSWIDGNYFFEDEQFTSIIKKLERGFNVNINVNVEKLKSEKYSGTFDNNESLNEILDIMKLKRDFDYYTSKDTLHIINKN